MFVTVEAIGKKSELVSYCIIKLIMHLSYAHTSKVQHTPTFFRKAHKALQVTTTVPCFLAYHISSQIRHAPCFWEGRVKQKRLFPFMAGIRIRLEPSLQLMHLPFPA